jgi:hypothetical protein
MDPRDVAMANGRVRTLWPEDRWVPAEELISWACDQYDDEGPHSIERPEDLEAAIVWLGESGDVTFARA